jgi:hypothetical protein
MMLEEPPRLQKRIREFREAQRENNVKLLMDSERVVKKSRDGEQMMEFHDQRFSVSKAPAEIKEEVAHAVVEDERRWNRSN